MIVARLALPRGNADGMQVHAVGLRALEQGHVPQPGRPAQRLDDVLDHLQIGGHLVGVLPARDQAGLFVDGGIHHMRHLGQRAEAGAAGVGVPQVHRQMGERLLAEDFGAPAGNGDDFPAFIEEGVDGGGADQPAGASDENSAWHPVTLFGVCGPVSP
ncbi:hypothetical protein D9M72_172580 [compost metagenome]